MLLKRKVILESSIVFERLVHTKGFHKCSRCRYFNFKIMDDDCRYMVVNGRKLVDICYLSTFHILSKIRRELSGYVYIVEYKI